MPFLTFAFKLPLEAFFQINGFGEELSTRLQNVQEDLEFCHGTVEDSAGISFYSLN